MIYDLTGLSKADACMEQLYWLIHGPMQAMSHANIVAGGVTYTAEETARRLRRMGRTL